MNQPTPQPRRCRPQPPSIPPPRPDDLDMVECALTVATSAWSRGDSQEALRWLRKAARSAAENDADRRALELSKAAAELTTELDDSAAPAETPPPPPAIDAATTAPPATRRPSLGAPRRTLPPRAVTPTPAKTLPLARASSDAPSSLRRPRPRLPSGRHSRPIHPAMRPPKAPKTAVRSAPLPRSAAATHIANPPPAPRRTLPPSAPKQDSRALTREKELARHATMTPPATTAAAPTSAAPTSAAPTSAAPASAAPVSTGKSCDADDTASSAAAHAAAAEDTISRKSAPPTTVATEYPLRRESQPGMAREDAQFVPQAEKANATRPAANVAAPTRVALLERADGGVGLILLRDDEGVPEGAAAAMLVAASAADAKTICELFGNASR